MPKFIIERELPGAGDLTPDQLQSVSRTSCGVLRFVGQQIEWDHGFVTAASSIAGTSLQPWR